MKKFIFLIISIITLCISFVTTNTVYAYSENTNVLDDLKKDSNFIESDYKILSVKELNEINTDDNSYNNLGFLNVIQIAESSNKRLFIYVYNPTYDTLKFDAKKININTNISEKKYLPYDLELINSNGVFSKYVVKNFLLPDEEVRMYEISSIYRDYEKSIDGEDNFDETTLLKAETVGQRWTVLTNSNSVNYIMKKIDVITITASYYDHIRYITGKGFVSSFPKGDLCGTGIFSSGTQAVDSHYVVFSTDRQMDELLDADVYFTYQCSDMVYIWENFLSGSWHYVEEEGFIHINEFNNNIEIKSGSSFYDSQSLKRILTAKDFLEDSSVNLADTTKAEINDIISSSNNTTWMLRYFESDYQFSSTGGESTSVSDIYDVDVTSATILRLKFETDGVIYNLGVVDDIKDPGNIPGGNNDINDTTKDTLKLILILVFGLLVLYLFSYIKPVSDVVVMILKSILSIIVFIVKLPYTIINALFGDKK